MSVDLKDVRETIVDRCIKILAAYRKTCASSSSPGQLILPESLKLFPLYSLTLIKSHAFRLGMNLNSDLRVQEMRYIRSMGVATSIACLYPRMFTLHDLDEKVY